MYPLINEKKYIFGLLNREIILSDNDTIIKRMDINGNIIYYNSIFSKLSGYKRDELINTPYFSLLDRDMPKAVIFFIWKSLLAGNNTSAIIKNRTKQGEFYWQLVKFKVQKDNNNKIISFLLKGEKVSREAISKIEPFYGELIDNENSYGIVSSIDKLYLFLNENNIATYDDYISNIITEKKYSFFSNLRF